MSGVETAKTVVPDWGEQAPHHRRLVLGLILATAAITVTVMTGWILENDSLKRIVPGLTTMNPMTACCLMLACLALSLARPRPLAGPRQIIVLVAAGCIFFVGVAKLIDLTTGTRLCPDGLLFAAQTDRQLPYPSRIAPNVAGSFVLVATALFAIDRPGWPRWLHPQGLMIPVIAIALTALIGYSYDTSGFYTFRQYIPMALHSAVGLICVALAMIFLRPEEGFVRLLPAGSLGARSARRLLPACIAIPILLGGLTLGAVDHGWITGHGADTAMVAVLTVLALSALTLVNSVALNRADAVRLEAEMRLKALVVELDARNSDLRDEVRERRSAEERAAHRASHDFLTGLPNRLCFVDRLEEAVSHSFHSGDPLALIYIDLDAFKPINDIYGHNAGDALLVAFAKRLAGLVRQEDTVARLGGDEFGVIVRAPVSEEDAFGLATRIAKATTRRYQLRPRDLADNISVEIGISMGIALLPAHALDLDDLVKVADGAMYRAKLAGKARGRLLNIEVASASHSN